MAIEVVKTPAQNFGKPSMTDLPYDLGKRIINTILNSPKPDFTDSDKEIAELEEKILKDRSANNE
ncbi:hypothetical protein SAMN05216349_1475 [Oribacterium sp. KHPX15]|uniref:hypothetical protein n=1 Tax=unclassified Oribacterium TaxID=2629782 RepID=UPI0004E11AF1|nr:MULTISPECIES: hypothetical protein [unclassified Oribacterium]SEA89751.1 hypothetical protein SAMN05216349_1475 [Oribacterium sp. KHPX15]